MTRVFLSYASEDRGVAGELHKWLCGDGHEVFLDRDLQDGIAVGERWQDRLYERLRWADAVVCLVSAAYVRSMWCGAEVAIAHSRGARLLPLSIEAGVSHPLLATGQYQYADYAADPVAARAAVAGVLRRLEAGGGSGWPDGWNPFPGLRAFDTDRQRVFFARHTETEALAEVLRSPAEQAEGGLVVVIGPTGCGKSSLVRAGLLPVMANEPGWWVLPPLLPGADPVAALARELTAAGRRLDLDWTLPTVRQRLDDQDGLLELTDELLLAAPCGGGSRRRLLVTIDQADEIVTRTPAQARAAFAAAMHPALLGPVQAVATLRPEFLARVLVSRELAGLPVRTFTIRPLTDEALPLVITEPARVAGIDVDAELVARLVDDTDSGQALPLLAFTLAQLADGVGRGGRLSATRYEQLGGVRGALLRQADAALAEAQAASGRTRDQVIAGLLRLVTIDEQARPARRRVPRAQLPAPVAAELDVFITHRLLATDTEHGEVVIGVAHEAFMSAWPPLASAIAAAGVALRARRAIEEAAADWDNAGRSPDRLWERGQLAAALIDTGTHLEPVHHGLDPQEPTPSPPAAAAQRHAWVPSARRLLPGRVATITSDKVDLSPTGQAFLHASIRRDRRRRARTTAVLSMLLLVAMAGIVWLAMPSVNEFMLKRQARTLSPAVRLVPATALVSTELGQRRVAFPAVLVDVHEVTNRQYRFCVEAKECPAPNEPADNSAFANRDNTLPVVFVNAYQAAKFCAWLGRRLPTEAEWERGARGTEGRRFPWGNDLPTPDQVNAIVSQNQPKGLVPVGSPGFQRGRTLEGGIEHMIGNAGEWTTTRVTQNERGDVKRLGTWDGRARVNSLAVKGGSWRADPDAADSADVVDATLESPETGFRCVATAE
jgi:formylglycine-generating enzyme required for sulfatase activity/energy-coupling factor transporter ATP-binding protein EcfA2